VVVIKALRNFCWAKREWGRLFGIIHARSERGANTSKFLVDEVRVWQALRDFLVDEVSVGQVLWDLSGRNERGEGCSEF
jgi:hypothetical protein